MLYRKHDHADEHVVKIFMQYLDLCKKIRLKFIQSVCTIVVDYVIYCDNKSFVRTKNIAKISFITTACFNAHGKDRGKYMYT